MPAQIRQPSPSRIALFTDFGSAGIYTGQVKAVLSDSGVPQIDLLCDAPVYNPRASAYLLAALSNHLPEQTLFLCVVDPGVGSERLPVVVQTDRYWFVGPDNGLFSQLLDSPGAVVKCIGWRPETLSDSFHGRDLFAPVAVRLCKGEDIHAQAMAPGDLVGVDWPADLPEVIYFDHYGNAMTGIRGSQLSSRAVLRLDGSDIRYAKTFSEVGVGKPFWYRNSIGLVEIAVNRGRADRLLGLGIGSPIETISSVYSPG